MIERVKLFNTDALGVFAQASDRVLFVPSNTSSHVTRVLKNRLDIKVLELKLGGIAAVGIMLVANDKGVVLPYNVDEDDIRRLKAEGFNVARSNSKTNALGNLVVANSRVGFASPKLGQTTVKLVEDTLDVEIIKTTVGGLTTVGSALALNNKGFACHPQTSDSEMETIVEATGLKGLRVTVNSGYPYIRSGMIYNDGFALLGYTSTGIEMAEIGSALSIN
jgi:translation initiation factor 6